MKQPHWEHDRLVRPLIFGLSLFLATPCSFSLAQAVTPITSSGLNTQIGAPTILPGGETVYDITGGTRPGGGTNLFHSFGDFSVPTNNIANFRNDSGLATSNILGRVTGGNISNIFGTIQTTGFGNANLFLVNPAGFLFGQGATVNVGGMVTFTSADYLKLADGARFNAIPNASADALLSAAPVAAFGFLGSNPGAITVQGSQLTVTEETGISLVGGNITVQGGTLTAPSGQINLVSVGSPSKPNVGGEVVIAGSGQGSGFTPTGFASLGAITLSQGSTIDASAPASTANNAGSVVIRGGQFVMNDSSLKAVQPGDFLPEEIVVGGTIEVTAEQVALSNHSTIDASITGFDIQSPGHITFNVGTFSATDSAILAPGGRDTPGGAVTIQGLQGSGSFARSVSLTNTVVNASSRACECGAGNDGGPIRLQAAKIAISQSQLISSAGELSGGSIALVSLGGLVMRNSSLDARSTYNGFGGTVNLQAGTSINLTNTIIDTSAPFLGSGTITLAAPVIALLGSRVSVGGTTVPGYGFVDGLITLTGTKSVSLNDTILSANGTNFSEDGTTFGGGGNILINGGGLFTSQLSTISARSGGTIQVEAARVRLTDTLLTTSTSGGPQSVGGSITVDAKNTTLKNSQILSTADEGQGGTIDITSSTLKRDATTVIDASSQSGTDGTVTINGVIQP